MRPCPPAFRGLARRVLEFPSFYQDLGALADVSGVGRDALRARFRRRGLESPTVWMRLLRVLVATHVLSDRSTSVQAAARRLGVHHGGNFCRLIRDVAGISPTEAREPRGRVLLVRLVAEELLAPGCRAGWESLDDVFLEGVA